ncbi:IclR family transcriptional regulator [Stappia indica]|uniref:Helix-turn-helix domain-containing protein n=1 Tax=Stappia indica TaxID=538381 RepID=A0A857C9W1_9HYPH|nr:IclR family transcriptional regulator C-terminal domain-containing protein [Stappia indica]QGZ35659.1 helix-turn-helix domain-containing protein [Stappia indica]
MSEKTTESRDLLERQLQLLELVARNPDGLGFSGLQTALDLPKASIHRLIAGLVKADCIAVGGADADGEPGEGTGRGRKVYMLGNRIRRLLGSAVDPQQIVALSQTVLHRLAEEFKESAFLSVLRGDRVETAVLVTPAKDAHGFVNPGRIMPAHAAASAKAIFAFRDEAEWDRILKQELTALTDLTLTSPAAVKKEYRAVRESGIAYCREEIDRGLMGIAAPLHLPQIGVIYAVSIVGPSNRIREHDEKQLEASLIKAAGELSEIFTANLRIDRA